MPRRERVDGAPERRDQEREQDRRRARGRRAGSATRSRRCGAPAPAPRRSRAAGAARLPGLYATVALRTSSGERRRLCRVGAELVRAARRRRRARRRRCAPSRALTMISRQPIRLANAWSAKRQLRARRRGAVDRVEAHRLQPAGARSLRGAVGEDGQRHAHAVDAELELCARGSPRSRAAGPPLPPGTSGSRPGRARSGRRRVLPARSTAAK